MSTELRFAFRSLANSKGFAAIAIISLALALGLNTTTYAVLDSFMHPYVPYRAPDRLVSIMAEGDTREVRVSWAARDAMLRERLALFSDSIALWRLSVARVQSRDVDGDVYVKDVTSNYLDIVDVKPELGRPPRGDLDETAVAVSRDFWLRALGGTRDLNGVSITIDGRSYAVAAVLPSDPNNPVFMEQIWRVQPRNVFRSGFFLGASHAVARLRDGVRVAQVQETFNQLAKSLEKEYGIVGTAPFRYRVQTWRPDPYELSAFHRAMAAGAFAILVIACANLANLMAARGVARRRELALRLAIGARRLTLVRQLALEAVILAVAGGALGVVASLWGVGVVTAAMPQMEFLRLREPQISWRLFAFGVLATSLTVVLFGLIPAIRASDVDLAEPLKQHSATITGRTRRYSLLAMVQLTLALIVTMSAVLLVKSGGRVAEVRFGFDQHGLYELFVGVPRDSQPQTAPLFFNRILDAATRVNGVRSVATVANVATAGGVAISDFESGTAPMIMLRTYRLVSPNFFTTLGLPVAAGRDFLAGDTETAGAAIVNDSAARVLWPGQNPVGHMVKLGHQSSAAPWVRVIGVAGEANLGRFNEIDRNLPQPPEVYVVRRDPGVRSLGLVFRVAPTNKKTPIQLVQAVKEVSGNRQSALLRVWSGSFDYYLGSVRFATRVFLVLACCGLGLAAVGLYGVVIYGVNRRMREFGVRVALGATRSNLRRMVMHDVLVMYLAATAVGAFVAMVAAQSIDSLLYLVAPTDVASLVLAEATLGGVALLACLVPARHAANSDPVEILRAT